MYIANSTLIFLAASNILSSPFCIQSASFKIQRTTFQHSNLNKFSSHFFFTSTSFNFISKGYNFGHISFSNFLDSPIKFDGTHITNITYTSQKSVSVYSDVFISYCTFKHCHSTNSNGGALSVSTPSSQADDSSTAIIFQLKFTLFYNCSAPTSGAIYIQFNGELTIYSVCFNNCQSSVANQAGYIDISASDVQINIKYISFFNCPCAASSLTSNIGRKNCFQIKAEKMSFPIKYMNSSLNYNNNDRGCVLTLTGVNDVEISFPIIINNTGSDGFSMNHVASVALIDGLFAYNSFSVAPFNSYGFITSVQPYQIFLYSVDYLYNDVSKVNSVTGSITIYAVKCQIDPPDSSFGDGVLLSINNHSSKAKSSTGYQGKFFPDSCFYVKPSTSIPASKTIRNSTDLIMYCLIGGCGFIIICISIILIVYCVVKKRKINKWIEENDSSKQNSSIISTAFVDNYQSDYN